MLHVKDSSVVFTGPPATTYSPIPPPVNGPGIRMMWYAQKAAFRVGEALGQQWSADSTGIHSIAMGYDTRALGESSVAIGNLIKADGPFSIALGANNTTTGQQSTALGSFLTTSGFWSAAIGVSSESTGDASIVLGANNTASGSFSIATGRNSVANSAYEFVAGQYNDTTGVGSSDGWFSSDPLFVIGNGDNSVFRRNAVTVLKNGNTGIGTKSPQRVLHISKGSSGASSSTTTAALFEDNSDLAISLITPNINSSSIFFGNPANSVHGGIVYNSTTSPKGFDFRTNLDISRVVIDSFGRMGVGTTAPKRLLHVSNGSSGVTPHSSSCGVFEDDANVSISLITPDANESAIFFGNAASSTHGGIVYNSTVPNGLAFRTNGNSTKAVINDIGDMGIGDTSPNAKLHVSKGTSGSTYFSTAGIVVEDNSDVYLQFAAPSPEETGLISSSELTTMRAGIIFRPDSSVQIRAGGNTTKFSVDKSGNTNAVGEIRRSATGAANMVPICYGSVDANGTILSGSGNFSVTTTPPGYYEITITGETYSNSGYTTNVTPVSANPRFLSTVNNAGKLVVRTWTSAGALVDTLFHFAVYRN
ncbi:MAG TPA: hypothetical protein VGK46_09705 [Saprospiraceae bacterium]